MLIFFTLFFTLLSFWVMLFVFNSIFTAKLLLSGILIAFFVSKIVIKSKLYTTNSEFLFLQFGFYKVLITGIFITFTENIYLAFLFLNPFKKIEPIIDYLHLENENLYENNLTCNILNLNAGILTTMIKNQCIIVHSMNELFFSPNQLFFLNYSMKNINDDSLI